MTQKEIILLHLKEVSNWVREYDLRSKKTNFGWIGSQGDRRCRELFNEGKLERRLNGKYAEYRIGSKIPCIDKTSKNAQSTVIDKKEEISHIPVTNQAHKKEVSELQSTAQSLLKNIKFGDKRLTEANLQFKILKKVRTDKDRIRILEQIIYILSKKTI